MNIDVLFERLASPARRALMDADIDTLENLAEHTEAEISGLHGIGRNAMSRIKATLEENGLSLKRG